MKRVFSIVFLLAVMAFIFYMSAQDAARSFSYNVELVKLLKIRCGIDLYSLFDRDYIDILVRKFGHFFEFSTLSIALYSVLSAFRIRRVTIMTFSFCIAAAAADEFHQLYVIGRSGRMIDVIIDSLGIMMTISIISLVRMIKYELSGREKKYGAGNGRSLL